MLDVNVSPQSDSKQTQNLIQEIEYLSIINSKILCHCFQIDIYPEPQKIDQFTISDGKIEISSKWLKSLKQQLTKCHRILQNLHSPEPHSNIHQYSFLTKTWHHNFSTSPTELCDRVDNLNKTISVIKQRTRNLVLFQNQERNHFWNQQLQKRQKPQKTYEERQRKGGPIAEQQCSYFDHPLFQVMNQKVAQIGMECQDIRGKYFGLREENYALRKKYSEIEGKIGEYKEKMKKIEKQMFQITKKKAQLQKKLLQKQVNNKQNQQTFNTVEKSQNLHCEYIMLLQQDEQQNSKSEIHLQKAESFNSANIREKYRNAKNLSRKSIACISPNTSIDSIKSVKFERNCGKRLFVKGGP